MASRMLKQTRVKIILSLNAIILLIVGILIGSAIGLNNGIEFHVVAEKSDVKDIKAEAVALLNAALSSENADNSLNYVSISAENAIGDDPVASGQLWNEDAITIYQSADVDLCVSGSLNNLGSMYWRSSDSSVISGFYASARTWLGYNAENCRYPIIAGPGTTTITAGTYDGSRYDTLTVTVTTVPVEQWKREVLDLVNEERSKNGLANLSWGTTCEEAANTRAKEIMESYSHTRPDGSSWSTACPLVNQDSWSGENLAAGNSAVSPKTVVEAWMASEKHRENILNPNFTKLAVGFVFDPSSEYETYWSQYFSNY